MWVHGGAFSRGSGRTDMCGCDYLIEKNVVIVTLNYRLGPIGFVSFQDPSLNVPGNAGLKDIVFALNWVKRNIQNFGGDPDQVTIFGESAGGCSVHYLTLTDLTKGLFNRAIIMSASAFNKTWSLTPSNRNMAERLARKLGWKGKKGDEKSIMEFLEATCAYEINEASKVLLTDEEIFGEGAIVPFGPTIEPYISDNCLLPKDPVLLARDSWSNEIDILLTVTSFEGLLRAFVDEDKAAKILQNPSFFAPLKELELSPSDERAHKYGHMLQRFYYGILEPSIENQEQYLKFQSDLHFWHGIHRTILSRNAHATGKTYFMRFNVDADLNMFKALKNSQMYKGACHADDLFYIFKTQYADAPEKGSREYEIIQRMIGIFTSFAVTGDPNCKEIANIKWKQQKDYASDRCIEINENGINEIELPEHENMQIWDLIYEEQNVPLF